MLPHSRHFFFPSRTKRENKERNSPSLVDYYFFLFRVLIVAYLYGKITYKTVSARALAPTGGFSSSSPAGCYIRNREQVVTVMTPLPDTVFTITSLLFLLSLLFINTSFLYVYFYIHHRCADLNGFNMIPSGHFLSASVVIYWRNE